MAGETNRFPLSHVCPYQRHYRLGTYEVNRFLILMGRPPMLDSADQDGGPTSPTLGDMATTFKLAHDPPMITIDSADQDGGPTSPTLGDMAATFKLAHDPSRIKEETVIRLQRAMRAKFLDSTKFKRRLLIDRLEVEMQLLGGLRLLAMCIVLWVLVCALALKEKQNPEQLGMCAVRVHERERAHACALESGARWYIQSLCTRIHRSPQELLAGASS